MFNYYFRVRGQEQSRDGRSFSQDFSHTPLLPRRTIPAAQLFILA